MAKTKQQASGVRIEDLKKSLSTLTSEMNPDQLKRANETLEKLESVSKKDTEKNEEIQKTNLDVKKSLGKDGDINKTLKEMLKFYKTSNEKVIKKLDELKTVQGVNKVGDIRNEKPMTLKEGLKGTVAGIKGAASSVGRGVRALGSGILEAVGNPIGVAKRAGKAIMGKAGGLLTSAKDVLATPEEYTIAGGRYADEYSKSKQQEREAQGGSLMDPATAKKLDAHVGLKNYNDLQKVESKMGTVEDRINDTKTQGFQPLKKDVEELKSLSEKHSSVDVRNQMKPTEAPVAAAEKANQAAEATAIAESKKAQQENPEADNIRSAQEVMADNSKEDLDISKQLLETTKESLQELKGIKEALSGSVEPLRTKPVEAPAASAGAEVAAAEGGSGLGIGDALDVLDRGKGKGTPGKGFPRGGAKIPGPASKPSLGGRILGGAKGIGNKLGGLARGAGSLLSKAAVPLAVAGAGYSAYQGVGRAGENFDLKEGEEATLGQKTSSALGSVASDFSFGIVDEKSAAQGIHKAGSAVKDFFTGGDKDAKEGTNVVANVGTGASGFPLEQAPNVSTGASGFPLKSEAKPAETAAGTKVGGKGGPNWEAAKKDLEQGLPPPGAPEYDVKKKVLDLAQSSAPRTDNPQSIENHLEKLNLRASAAVAGIDKKPGTATFKEGKLVQPAAAEGKLSSDPQMDQDIKANRKRAAEVTPTRPSTTPSELNKSSLEYTDLERENAQSKPSPAPVILNNSSNNATTQVVPMKGDPRPNSRGSALDKYLDRTTAF